MTTTRTLQVSLHAISRWRERFTYSPGDNRKRTDHEIRQEIGNALANGRRVRLRDASERANKAATHRAISEYVHFQSVVLVISEGSVVSVYEYLRHRWEVMP